MTKISQYSTDVNITGNDKWIGSDAQNYLITKNFTPNNLANYFNGNNVIDIGTSIRYKYQTLDPGELREQGTISFETEIGPQVNFSAITTFLIAKNSLKQNDVSQYLDFLVDGKVLLSKASNINVFGYYKITSLEPWITNPNFFVVTVDFLSGNGFIYEDLDYLISLVDKVQDIPPPVWGSITGNIEDQTDLIDYISSQIITPTLSDVLGAGNTTGGNPISISNGDYIVLDNGSKLKKGTTDSGNGGLGGIALKCSVDYELKWDAGRLFVMQQDGFTIRETLYNFNITPNGFDDSTKGYEIGSRWVLDDGSVYVCTDNIANAAIWELQLTDAQNLQNVTDIGNTTTNDIIVQGPNDYIGQVSSQGITVYNTVTGAYAEMFIGTSGQLSLSNVTSTGIFTVNNLVSTNVQLEFPNKPTGTYTIATTADLTLQQVLDNNHDLVNGNNFQGTQAGYLNTGTQVIGFGSLSASSNTGINVNAFGSQALQANTANHVNGFGQEVGASNTYKNVNLFGYRAYADANNQTVFSKWISGSTTYLGRLSFNNITDARKWELPDASGTIALTSNIGNWGTLNYPTWTTGTPFVKMTAAGTFALDTNTYLTGITSSDVTTALGYTPVTNARTLTINGTTYDLSADRTWTIAAGVTSVSATSPITSSGGATPIISTSMATNKLIGRSTAGTGVMEEITIGTGLSLSAGTLTNTATYTSPLTTKGDIFVRNATVDTRLPVGLDTQVLLADSSTTTGLKWGTNTAATPTGYYGAWQDNVTQTAALNNVGYAMIFRTTDLSNGVTVVTNGTNLTRITFANTGIYNLQFSSQFQNIGNSEADVTIWIRKDGTDIPGSAGFVTVPKRTSAGAGNEGHTVVGWNYLLSVVAGEYYEIIWSTTNATNVTMQYYAAGSPPPSTASVIATVTQQSGIMAGTGMTSLTTTGSSGAATYNSGTGALNIPQYMSASTRRNANNSTNNNINYCGVALGTGVSESSAVWTITRLTIAASGSITTAIATNVAWTNRESAIYT